jgi:hypothetical protein
MGAAGLISGCPGRGSSDDIDPNAHVTDWHETPVRGLADPITVESNGTQELPCLDPAWDALESRITTRIDNLTGVSHGSSGGYNDIEEDHLFVTRTIYAYEGKVESKPVVSFARLREITPRTIRVEIQTRGTKRRCQWPVYVYDEVAYKL